MTTTEIYDLVLQNARVVSLFTGEIFPADVALQGDKIEAILPPANLAGREVIDAAGKLVVPGFIDAHMHIESSFVTPGAFAHLTLPRGTTTVLADPHEIVNVAGKAGLLYMIEASQGAAQSIFWGVPSCVPSLPGYETAGAEIKAADVSEMLDYPNVIALGEVMDYRAVVGQDERTRSIIAAARQKGVILDGHCPGIHGSDLNLYLASGVDSDHTKNSVEVALEKARMGMLLQLQEKSIRPELIEALMALPLRPPLCLVTDDIAPDAIVNKGHLDHIGRRAIEAGMPPLEVLRALTWNPAQRLRLYDRGIVSPGKRADLLLVDSLEELRPALVIAGGKIVARAGIYTGPRDAQPAEILARPFLNSLKLGRFTPHHFRWRLEEAAEDGEVELKALEINPVDTYTRAQRLTLPLRDGEVEWEGKTLLLAIYERYLGSGGHSFAPVLGLELAGGAIATTYAHDSHNLVVLGTSRRSMALAANAVIEARGGIAVVAGDEVTAQLKLPVAGLLSLDQGEEVARQVAGVRQALVELGYHHANPFMSLSTLSLPVSPALKLTDKGLIHVTERRFTSHLCAQD
jgi:adenine deaminase